MSRIYKICKIGRIRETVRSVRTLMSIDVQQEHGEKVRKDLNVYRHRRTLMSIDAQQEHGEKVHRTLISSLLQARRSLLRSLRTLKTGTTRIL